MVGQTAGSPVLHNHRKDIMKLWKKQVVGKHGSSQTSSMQLAFTCVLYRHCDAAGTWPCSVGTNYAYNLLCSVFSSTSNIKIILCHTVLTSINTFIVVTPESLVGPTHQIFPKVLDPIQFRLAFVGLVEDAILAVPLVACQPSWLGDQGPETVLSQPYLSLKHRGNSGGTQHSQSLCHQLFNVNILLLLFRFFSDLCCGSSPKPSVFSQLSLTA